MEDASGRREILERLLAQVLYCDIDQRRRRLAEQDLAAVRRCAQPCGVVDINPPIVVVAHPRRAGVHAHPHPQLAPGRRGLLPERALSRSRRLHRPSWIRKCDEERIALMADLNTTVLRPHGSQRPIVLAENLLEGLTELA